MITSRSAMLRVWDVLLYEGNCSMLFKIGLVLIMEIHGMVGKMVLKHLKVGFAHHFCRRPPFFMACKK